ncbi:hypothetical protein ACWGBH_08120 [Streptomyces massasporeus]
MRWSLMSLIAAALLAVATARHRADSALGETRTDSEALIALTRPEPLRLLRTFALSTPVTTPKHALHWSHWRRRHQHRAATCHRRWNEVTAAT